MEYRIVCNAHRPLNVGGNFPLTVNYTQKYRTCYMLPYIEIHKTFDFEKVNGNYWRVRFFFTNSVQLLNIAINKTILQMPNIRQVTFINIFFDYFAIFIAKRTFQYSYSC